jgi:hypothetical protein
MAGTSEGSSPVKSNCKLLAIALVMVAQVAAADTFTVGPDPTWGPAEIRVIRMH